MNRGIQQAPREAWMDVLRGGAILAVVAYHASAIASEFEQIAVPGPLAAFNIGFAPLRMPTLMLLSGLLLKRSFRKPAAEYAFGKISRIFYPMVVWSLIYWIVGQLRGGWYQPGLHVESSYLWFLEFLFAYYMAGLALQRWLISRPQIAHAIVIGGALGTTFLTAPDSKEQSFALLAVFFFGGSWIAHNARLLERLLSSRVTWITLPVAALAVVLAVKGAPVATSAFFVPLAAAAIVGLMKTARSIAPLRPAAVLRWAGRDSLVFYVSHFPITALILDLDVQVMHLPRSVSIVSAFVGALLAGAALVRLKQRFAPFAMLFRLEHVGAGMESGVSPSPGRSGRARSARLNETGLGGASEA